MKKNYRYTKTTVSFINYHFVFCPRYRRKIFDDVDVSARFKQIVGETCEKYDWRIESIDTNRDHCYLSIEVQPTFSPSKVMTTIKDVSSRIIREEFEHLSKMPSLWTRSYFVSTAEKISQEVIEMFVENQRKRY